MSTNSDFSTGYPTPSSIGWNEINRVVAAPATWLGGRQSGAGIDYPMYPGGVVQQGPARSFGNLLMKLPGVRNVTEAAYGYDPYNTGGQAYLSPADRLLKAAGGAATIGSFGIGGFVKPLLTGILGDKVGSFGGDTKFQAPAQTPAQAAATKYKNFSAYAAANPNSEAVQAVKQVDALFQGVRDAANVSLSPEQKLAYELAAESLRRNAGQASATDALQKKQAEAQAQRGILDLQRFTSGANQDVMSTLASAGMGDISAAGMGAQRGLLDRQQTGTQEIKTNLAEWLARQKLSAGQRGSDVSYGMSAIERQKAAALQAAREAIAAGKGLTY